MAEEKASAARLVRIGESVGLVNMNAFPGADGGVEVAFYQGSLTLEIGVLPSSRFTACVIDERNKKLLFFSEAESWDSIVVRIREFAEK